VGKLAKDQAEVKLSYGIRGETPTSRTFALSRDGAPEGTLLKRLWAQKKLADLMIFQHENEETIVSLGKQFGMVTPFTSLLVLDTLEQYVEYEVPPPASLPEMREEYMRRIDTLEFQQRKERQDKLASVVAMWEERVKWWESQFKYPKDFKYQEPPAAPAAAAEGRGPGNAPGAPPPAAEPAMPAPAEPVPATPPAEAPARDAPRPSAGEAGGGQGGGQARGEAESKDEATEAARQPGIVIKPWDPQTPYLDQLRSAREDQVFAVYMKNRAEYGDSPAFFLDCADFFAGRKDPRLALQVLSNIGELGMDEPMLMRVMGHRLRQLGYLDLAALVFEEVLKLRPEEPQSYRDLALVLAERAQEKGLRKPGSPAAASDAQQAVAVRKDYARAIELLSEVVMRPWDDRFPQIEVTALEELNAMLPKAQAAGVKDVHVDKRLVKLMDVDVRIVMTWEADNTDMDLWVLEPSGEKAFYSHNRTTIGGLVSPDFTRGYGPEEYLVRKAMPGMYTVQTNYYGSQATRLLGAITVQVDVFTNFGRANQDHRSLTVRLKEAKETVTIGQIEF